MPLGRFVCEVKGPSEGALKARQFRRQARKSYRNLLIRRAPFLWCISGEVVSGAAACAGGGATLASRPNDTASFRAVPSVLPAITCSAVVAF